MFSHLSSSESSMSPSTGSLRDQMKVQELNFYLQLKILPDMYQRGDEPCRLELIVQGHESSFFPFRLPLPWGEDFAQKNEHIAYILLVAIYAWYNSPRDYYSTPSKIALAPPALFLSSRP